MGIRLKRAFPGWLVVLLALAWASNSAAKPDVDACLELGALAYDDWTSIDGGGSGWVVMVACAEQLALADGH